MFRRKGKVEEGKRGGKKEKVIFTCKIVTARNHVSTIHVDMCACTVLSLQIHVYQFKAVNYFYMIMILNQKKTAVCNNYHRFYFLYC